ncbi:transcription elongation factor GreA [bacterium]|nr:transcription elongation factor GreA [bacterium]
MALNYITQEGYNKIKDDLNYLIQVKRKEIAQKLETARSHGDLKENAEYDAAKEAQAMNERRIAELTEKLTTSSIINESDIPEGKAFLGSIVTIEDLDDGEIITYKLVSEPEADILEGKISVKSPVGKGLMGTVEGQEVEIQVPAGVLKYKIIKLER